jgi:hypothetical protein
VGTGHDGHRSVTGGGLGTGGGSQIWGITYTFAIPAAPQKPPRPSWQWSSWSRRRPHGTKEDSDTLFRGVPEPETRRLPYDDYGLIAMAAITGSGVAQAITGSGVAQAVAIASYDASTSGLVAADFVFLEFGVANEEHVNVMSVDTVNRTFTAIVTRNHPAGSSIRPSIWPTAVLLEGNDLAFDIKAVASPNSGSDLTVVVQT